MIVHDRSVNGAGERPRRRRRWVGAVVLSTLLAAGGWGHWRGVPVPKAWVKWGLGKVDSTLAAHVTVGSVRWFIPFRWRAERVQLIDSAAHPLVGLDTLDAEAAWSRGRGWHLRRVHLYGLTLHNEPDDSLGRLERWIARRFDGTSTAREHAAVWVQEWRVRRMVYYGRALRKRDTIRVDALEGASWRLAEESGGEWGMRNLRWNGRKVVANASGGIQWGREEWRIKSMHIDGWRWAFEGDAGGDGKKQWVRVDTLWADSAMGPLPDELGIRWPIRRIAGRGVFTVAQDTVWLDSAYWQVDGTSEWAGSWRIAHYRKGKDSADHLLRIHRLALAEPHIRRLSAAFGVNDRWTAPLRWVRYAGTFRGRPSDFEVEGRMASNGGTVEGRMQWRRASGQGVRYAGRLRISRLRVERWGGHVPVRSVSARVKVHGGGPSADSLRTHIDGTVTLVELPKGRPVRDVVVRGYLTPELFSGLVETHNPHADFSFNGVVDFGGEEVGTHSEWEVGILDFQALGVTPRETSFGGTFSLQGRWNRADSFHFEVDGRSLFVASADGGLLLDSMEGTFTGKGRYKALTVTAPSLTAHLRGRFQWSDPVRILHEWNRLFLRYPVKSTPHRPPDSTVELQAAFTVYHPEVLLGLVDWDVHVADSIRGRVVLDGRRLIHRVNVEAGAWSVKGVGGTAFRMGYEGDNRLGMLRMTADQLTAEAGRLVDEAQFTAALGHASASWNLLLLRPDGPVLIPLRGRMHYHGNDTLTLHFDTTDWVIFDSVWRFTSTAWQGVWGRWWRPGDVTVRSGKAYLSLRRIMNPDERYHLRAERFPVGFIVPHLGGMIQEVGGDLFADLTWRRADRLVHGQARITPLVFTGDTIGEFFIGLDAQPDRRRTLVDMHVYGPQRQHWIEGRGELSQLGRMPLVSLEGTIRRLPFRILHRYYGHIISDLEGTLDAYISVDGLLSAPLITGSIHAHNLGFTVDVLKTHYRFSHVFPFDHRRLTIDTLRLYDPYGGRAEVNGRVDYHYFGRTSVDLIARLDTLHVLNTTAADNDYFYGQAFASGRVSFDGPLADVFMNADLRSEEGTAVDLPLGEGAESGVYDFIEWISPQADESPGPTESYSFRYLMTTSLTPAARIRIWIDPQTGEHVEGRGKGVLTFGEPAADVPFFIRGRYAIDEGHYHFVALELFERRFDIQPGGYIQWRGDPYDAVIRLTAVHSVYADISDLLSGAVSDQQLAALRGQRYPVDVFIYLGGALMQPEIRLDFQIRLPGRAGTETHRILLSTIQRIRQDPDELMRQVISLLVFERFLPLRGELTEAFSSEAVYQNLSTIVSAQLSRLLNRLTSDVEYIDNLQLGVVYNPGEGEPGPGISRRRVELALSTQLFDERFYLSGRYDLQNLLGNLELSYRLNPDRSTRIRAFVQSQQNLWLGHYARQGIGISWSKDFDRWSELFPTKKRKTHDTTQTPQTQP